jgi:hypothetical protein
VLGVSSQNWNDDDELIRDLREALRQVPGEAQVIEAAQGAYQWHTTDIEIELATLRYDSDLDRIAGVRGPAPGAPRTVVLGTAELSVELEFSESGIEGQLIPPEQGTVRLLTSTGDAEETTTDELGCFRFSPRLRGSIRVACTVPGGEFLTEWVTV